MKKQKPVKLADLTLEERLELAKALREAMKTLVGR